MRNIALFAAVVLVFSVTLTPAFSEGDYQENDSQEKDDKFDFGGYANQTLSLGGYSNKTMVFEDSNKTNIGQEISDYVHKRNDLEKQQRDEILVAEKECRQQIKESGNKTATMQQCIEDLKSLREQYKSFVSQQNSQFKQFRQGITSNQTMEMPEQNTQVLYGVINSLSHEQQDQSYNAMYHTENDKTKNHPHH